MLSWAKNWNRRFILHVGLQIYSTSYFIKIFRHVLLNALTISYIRSKQNTRIQVELMFQSVYNLLQPKVCYFLRRKRGPAWSVFSMLRKSEKLPVHLKNRIRNTKNGISVLIEPMVFVIPNAQPIKSTSAPNWPIRKIVMTMEMTQHHVDPDDGFVVDTVLYFLKNMDRTHINIQK